MSNYKPTNFHTMRDLVRDDIEVLREKGASYGESWRARGGVGAFMMLARKWDRIENQSKGHAYDIFAAGEAHSGKDGLLDDIADLRRYLLLVEEHIHAHREGEDEIVPEYLTQ